MINPQNDVFFVKILFYGKEWNFECDTFLCAELSV
jgi:hypothetical protein